MKSGISEQPRVGDLARLRSKNAGPFWLTIDLFAHDASAHARLCTGLSTAAVADALGARERDVRRFQIDDLEVLKFSLPRPVVQGSRRDRDMHGASFAEAIRPLRLACDDQARP